VKSKTSKSKTLSAGNIWTHTGKPGKAKPTVKLSHASPAGRVQLSDNDLYEPRGEPVPAEKATAEQLEEMRMDAKIKADRARNAELVKRHGRLANAIFTPQTAGRGLEVKTTGVRHEQRLF
jgi:hypothetical protein